MRVNQPGARAPGRVGVFSVESLYPFLYAGTSDLPAVLEQVRASTVAKAEEILELRRAAWPATAPGCRRARRQGAAGSARAGGCSPSATAAAPPTPSSSPPCS